MWIRPGLHQHLLPRHLRLHHTRQPVMSRPSHQLSLLQLMRRRFYVVLHRQIDQMINKTTSNVSTQIKNYWLTWRLTSTPTVRSPGVNHATTCSFARQLLSALELLTPRLCSCANRRDEPIRGGLSAKLSASAIGTSFLGLPSLCHPQQLLESPDASSLFPLANRRWCVDLVAQPITIMVHQSAPAVKK